MNLLAGKTNFVASAQCAECSKKGKKCAEFLVPSNKPVITWYKHLVCQQCLEDLVDILSRISKRIINIEDLT